jgi:hypothetical protein
MTCGAGGECVVVVVVVVTVVAVAKEPHNEDLG